MRRSRMATCRWAQSGSRTGQTQPLTTSLNACLGSGPVEGKRRFLGCQRRDGWGGGPNDCVSTLEAALAVGRLLGGAGSGLPGEDDALRARDLDAVLLERGEEPL